MESQFPKKTEEIDLVYFFRPIGQAGRLAIRTLSKWWATIKRNWVTGIIMVLIFVGLGFSARFIVPKRYQTSAILLTHEIPADLCIIELSNLNQTINSEEDFSLLSKQLQISDKNASGIAFISAEKIPDINFSNDKDTSSQLFAVTLRIKNPEILDSVQTGIVQFLENNEYSRKRKEAKRVTLNKLKVDLEKKVGSLDSLKSVVNNSIAPRSQGQGIILGQPIDPVSIYQAEVAYFKEQLKINEDLATLDNIEIIQPFIKVKKSNYPNFNRILLYSFLLGVIAAFLVILAVKKKQVH